MRLFQYKRSILLFAIFSLIFVFSVTPTFAQAENLCRQAGPTTSNIEYGDAISSQVDVEIGIQAFCFEGERGDEITVTLALTSGNLNPILIVGTPFVDVNQGTLVDEPLIDETLNNSVGIIQSSATLDDDGTYIIIVQSLDGLTFGGFELSLEVAQQNILGSGGNNTDDQNTGDGGLPQIIPGETNLCETPDSITLAFDEVAEGALEQGAIEFICFTASEADIITIEALTTAGDAQLGFLVADPLYDFQQTTPIYNSVFAEAPDESATVEFIIQETGQYLILLFAGNDQPGEYSLTVTSEAGNIYNCSNDPLNTLSSVQWGIVDDESEVPIIEINIGCAELLVVSALGGSSVSAYSVDQEDTFFFVYQDRLYITASLSETEWVIEREDDGVQYTLQAISETDACSDEVTSQLINGSWVWLPDPSNQIIFEFTCNGIVIIDTPDSEFAATYLFEDETITIPLGVDNELAFDNVDIQESQMQVEIDGFAYDLANRLYEAPAEEE